MIYFRTNVIGSYTTAAGNMQKISVRLMPPPSTITDHVPDNRERDDHEHADDGAAADPVHA